jgi:hypothetical protein
VYVVEILTPEGWARAPETKGKALTEREALDVARLCYGVKLWSHHLGGMEKVRVVKLEKSK